MRTVVALVMLAGCGRIGFDTNEAVDALDAFVPFGPFGSVSPLGNLSSPTAEDENPSLTYDNLELYFSSNRPGVGDYDIYVSVRANLSEGFPPPVLITELSTTAYDGGTEISGDGLTMLISSGRTGGLGGFDLYQTTRTTRASPWGAPQPLTALNSIATDSSAVLNDAGDEIWFHTTRTGQREIFHATATCGGWCPPTSVAELNTTGDETDPAISFDQRTIYWSSTRPGGLGDRDLWTASRATASDPFTNIAPVTELNSAAFDSDPWLHPDMRAFVFTSTRGGTRDLYVASR